jgi:hypothetical protein
VFKAGTSNNMQTHHQIQAAIGTLSQAFSPLKCLITAPRKGNFSFTLVDEHGVACHTERLYPEQYSRSEPLQAVIARTRQSLTA